MSPVRRLALVARPQMVYAMTRRTRIVTMPDGTTVRVCGGNEPDGDLVALLQPIIEKIRAKEAARCTALSDVPMPEIVQRTGHETYRCGREGGHEGPHKWPEDTGRIAEWVTP